MLAGIDVFVVADRDQPGEAHARDVAGSLVDVAKGVTVVEAATGKDAADHLAAGGTVADFDVIASTDPALGGLPLADWLGSARSSDRPAADDGSEGAGRRVRLTPAAEITPRPVRWLWTDRIPVGEVTITPGRGGIGKSTFHAHTIARVTRGQLSGAHTGTPKACIIAATEDSWERTIVPRLIAAGANLELVYRVDVVTEGVEVSISLPADLAALEAEIIERDVALLSIDPLLGVIHGSLDTHKDAEVRQALQPLARLADRAGCAVLGNAHFNKSTAADPLALVMGSAGFGNVARAALGFARDVEADDGSCVISQIKNNLGRLDPPSLCYRIEETTIDTDEGPASVGRFVLLGESTRSVADILRDGSSTEDSTERNEVISFIRDYLIDHQGSAPAGEVLKAGHAAGFTDNAMKKARSKAGVCTKRSDFTPGSPWLWSIDSPEGATKVPKVPSFRTPEPSAPSASPSDPNGLF